MIILKRPISTRDPKNSQSVAIFGTGLIGGAVLGWLQRAGGLHYWRLPFTWGPSKARADESGSIEALLSTVSADNRVRMVDVVWAAGKSGFDSSADQLAPELDAFDDVLALSRRLYAQAPEAEWRFHMLSSEGGLFEGQRQVSAESQPSPLRPYGFAKLEQERRLWSLPDRVRKLVYRPSSVYGYTRHGRAGLVVVLIQNAITNRTTRIFGSPETLRDYVLACDVGLFVANRVMCKKASSQTFVLASGKPTSMAEIIELVQARMNRRLFLRYDSARSNALHNSVRPSALPSTWRPTSLRVGLARTADKIGTAFHSAIWYPPTR